MSAILNSLNAHSLPIIQPILMILVSKFMVYRALSDKTYLILGLLSPFFSTMFVSKRGRCSITLLDVTGDNTITQVTSIICIPLSIGVLGKRGTLGIITPVMDCLFIHSIISFLLALPKLRNRVSKRSKIGLLV